MGHIPVSACVCGPQTANLNQALSLYRQQQVVGANGKETHNLPTHWINKSIQYNVTHTLDIVNFKQKSGSNTVKPFLMTLPSGFSSKVIRKRRYEHLRDVFFLTGLL